jgi:hypothetical protein
MHAQLSIGNKRREQVHEKWLEKRIRRGLLRHALSLACRFRVRATAMTECRVSPENTR